MAFTYDESIKLLQTCEDAMFAAMSEKDQDEQYPSVGFHGDNCYDYNPGATVETEQK